MPITDERRQAHRQRVAEIRERIGDPQAYVDEIMTRTLGPVPRKESPMNDAVKRSVRTFAQGFIGVLALIAVPALGNMVQAVAGGGEVEVDVNFWQSVLIAAIAGGVIALISFGQNALEAKTHTNVLPK